MLRIGALELSLMPSRVSCWKPIDGATVELPPSMRIACRNVLAVEFYSPRAVRRRVRID